MLDYATFYFFAALALIGAVLVITSRNAIHSAIYLITTLLATAGIYLGLRAEFLFAVQIILYVGGIMVLFIFVIMLVNLDVAVRQIQFNRQTSVAIVLALAFAALVPAAVYYGRGLKLPAGPKAAAVLPNTETVGDVLFNRYLLPFEIASILLLVAMIGAVVLARKRL
jgi:NADH-quinone oxidoreductase subunit J